MGEFMNDFTRTSQIKARKTHTCSICGESIFRGNEYIYEIERFDGIVTEKKRHIHCDALLAAIIKKTGTKYCSVERLQRELRCAVCNQTCNEQEQKLCMENKNVVFSCEKCQKATLNPVTLNAARKSVRQMILGTSKRN